MSSDESKNVISRSLEGGAAFYIVKPANKVDLKNVWHYAVAIKTGNPLSIKEIEGSREPSYSSTLVERLSLEDVNSATSINDEKRYRKNGRKEERKSTKDDQEVDSQPASKKPKVVWTNSLHNRFLLALNHIGLDSKQNLFECFFFYIYIFYCIYKTFYLPNLFVMLFFVRSNLCRGCSKKNS